jgi:pimeloyl-ACP methyl ester carboxylesterase
LPALGTDFAIPVFIIQGRDDLKAPLEIARNYFNQIKAPQKEFFVAPRTGHEPTRASMDMILRVLLKQVHPLCVERHRSGAAGHG